ncbi:MAG: response regulator transcription factor [Chloroflexota bacterium]
MGAMHLLVAEDDQRLARLLQRGLTAEGHVVEAVNDGDAAFAMALEGDFDVLILDVMMPGKNGFEVISSLRARHVPTPVLMLTARGEVEDRVHGLDAGADDYLVKPFSFDELTARVRALGRRRGEPDESTLQFADLELDLIRREARRAGVAVDLGPTEFRLLEFFMRHPQQVLTRNSILSNVWGYEAEPETNIVDLYVHYLRRKLGDGAPIVTVRGSGYRLAEASS